MNGSTVDLRRKGVGRLVAVATLFLTLGAGQGFGEIPAGACGTTIWDLTAGQHIDVGTVTVANDGQNVYITYDLDDPDYPNACFGELHAWAGTDLSLVDGGGTERPSPGQLCKLDGGACADATGLTSYTFTIPFSQLSIVDVNDVCGVTLYVVTHAEVDLDCAGGFDENDHETAFGGPNDGPGNSWWFYGEYTICCDSGEPDPPFCQTAFAKGTHVWTTMKRANPDPLPSLRLTKARWGWAINLTDTGTMEYDIWAGAGLNDTSKGTKVGTLTVAWDGSVVTVTYVLFTGYYLEEVHVYAGDTSPTTIAPGQFGHIAEFDPNPTTYTTTISLADTDNDGVWLVAHAVVCDEE